LVVSFRESVPIEEDCCSVRHASTLLVLADGSLLVAWFSGTDEGAPDVGIRCASRSAGGEWSTPIRIDREPCAHWNPVLAQRKDGEIVLFYKAGNRISRWRTFFAVSADGGTTWTAPRELVPGDEGGRGPVRSKILILSDGSWLAGASLETSTVWTSFVDRSEDEGCTWHRGPDIALVSLLPFVERKDRGDHDHDRPPVSTQSFGGRGVIQPTLWEDADGSVHLLLRSTEGRAYRCDSRDGGRTWTEPLPTSIPNNNSGLDVVRDGKGNLILAHNPVAENWGVRTPLVLSFSSDGGMNWKQALTLDEGPGEFSYPALIMRGDELFVTWTRNRKEIAIAGILMEPLRKAY
jgi:predicted neuraminidase